MITTLFLSFGRCSRWRIALSLLLAAGPFYRSTRAVEMPLVSSRTITRSADLLDLPRDQATHAYPVHLRGVVTCFDQLAKLCFVYDGAASVYVYTTSSLELAPGDLVDVTAVTGAGLYSPIAQNAIIRQIGHTNLPAAKAVTFDQLATGREDCQFVQVEGTVHTEFTLDQNRYIRLGNESSVLPVCLLRYGEGAGSLLDAKVRIQGVAAGKYNKSDQRTGVQLFAPSPAQIQVLEPGLADPFKAPVIIGHTVSEYSRKGWPDHRVHLRGIVISPIRGGVFYMRDAGGGVRITTDQTNSVLRVGDRVDCAGFATPNTYSPSMIDTIFKVATNGVPVSAIPLNLEQAFSGKFDSDLVRINGRLLEIEPISLNESVLVLELDQRIFRAYLSVSKSGLGLLNGSVLSLTGICRVSAPQSPPAEAFHLLLRNRADLAVLELPVRRTVSWMLAGVALALLCGLFWFLSARRQVRWQTDRLIEREASLGNWVEKEVASEIASRKQAEQVLRLREQQLKASIDERERIARDLHDGLIQSIYAIGLNIEDCSCSVPPNAPQVRSRLGKIRDDLNCVIEEVRNFILGIESSTVTGSEFKTALKSIVLTMAESQHGKVRLDVDRRAAEELTPDQATQLLHIAREAMTNSLRHSNAGLIVFSLLRNGSRIRFEVKDNGQGFNVNLPTERGLGLRNMAARAAEMGATYTLASEPALGTRIMLDFEPKNGVSSSL